MADWTIEKRQPGGGLGLGWLLAIALGGGGLVFMGVGLLLAWHINRHRQPCRTRVYARSVDDLRTLSTRLTKRRLLDSASALPTTLSSRFSLSLPPVLPPLPAYNSFNFFRAPSHRRKAAHSWTAADYDDGYDYGCGGDHDYAGHWGRAWVPPDSVVADEQDHIHHGPFPGHARAKLEPVPTIAPMTLRQDQGLPRSEGTRAAAAAQAQVRPSATDTDLRDILRSTDERLRDGDRHGLSPIKTPRSSPVKHHWRGPTNPSRDMARAGRSTPSPTKRTASNTLTTQAMARDGSNVSTVSVANSLIAEVTQQLCLPGGSCSPSRLTGREWAPPAATAAGGDWQSQLSPLRTPPRSPQRGSPQGSSSERPGSRESVASSTLSTLYSVGEPEEEGEAQADEDEQRLLYHPSQQQPQTHQPRQRQQTVQQGQQAQQHGRMPSLDRDRGWPDPFSGHAQPSSAAQQTWPRKQKTCGPRPLRGSKPTMTATSACPTLQPLRPICANSLQARPESVAWPLRPPSAESSPAGKHDDTTSPSLAEATSESSFQTESVHTIDSDSTQQAACETPKAEWRRGSRILIRAPPMTASPLTPSRYSAASDVLSSPSPPSSPPSPYSEHKMLSMLLSASAPHRALPDPPAPATGSDVAALPTALTPRPRARRLSADADDPSISASSSVYSLSEPTALPASSPPGLGSTIAELRRMNSIVSSFSAASMASTAVGTDLADSPTLPSLVVAGPGLVGLGLVGLGLVGPMLPPPRSLARAGTVGSRHYLSIGAAKPPRPALHRKSALADSPRLARGKENQGLGLAPSAIKPAAMRRPPSGLRMLAPRCAHSRQCRPLGDRP